SPFIMKVNTKNTGLNLSDSTSFTITINSAYLYNYEVDWNNDGEYDESGITGSVTHEYEKAGIYTIRIRGIFPAIKISWGDRLKILSIDQWGDIAWESFRSAFTGTENLTLTAT